MDQPKDYYAFVQQHHQDLIKIADQARLVKRVKSHSPSAWDYLLVSCGDLLIAIGQRLKEHTFNPAASVDQAAEPCVECP